MMQSDLKRKVAEHIRKNYPLERSLQLLELFQQFGDQIMEEVQHES